MKIPNYRICVTAVIAFCALAPQNVFAKDPSVVNYGPEDTIGAANNLSQEGVKRAAKLIKTGKTYALGMITGYDTPVFGNRKYQIQVGRRGARGSNKASATADRLNTDVGIGTGLDGLGHVGVDGVYYNGIKTEDFFSKDGLKKLGTEHIPPMVTRGVLLDFAKLAGKRHLGASTAINSKEIKKAAAEQGIAISRGDVVLIHTGWSAMAEKDVETFIKTPPGIGVDGARYLAELGVVAVGSDTASLEVKPPEAPDTVQPVHVLLLARYGVYIMENVVTAELAADNAYEFMFVLGQPRFQGSVQAVINPIAIR